MHTPFPIPTLHESHQELLLEQTSLHQLAQTHGTPLYVYSKAALQQAWDSWQYADADRPIHLCYSVKSNSNIAVLQFFARQGAYFDIVSKGELMRVLAAGAPANHVVFSGVGKTTDEITCALEHGIYCFNVESLPELDRIHEIASSMGKRAPISLRINPDVDAQTHPYISTGLKENKFGIDHELAEAAYVHASSLSGLIITGIDYHIGSQLTQLTPFLDAQNRLFDLVKRLANRGIELTHIDLGGGLGVRYQDETPPLPAELIAQSIKGLREAGLKHTLMYEPGRSMVANAGLLLTTVEYLKPTPSKNFAIVDAAMNDLIRPTLYQAWMEVVNTTVRDEPKMTLDVVGPICETGDWLAKDRDLAVHTGDVLAILSAGAYGMTMSSNYNTRARAAEILVDGDQHHLIRQRETLSSLWANEQLLP